MTGRGRNSSPGIGASNVIRGKGLDATHAEFAGVTLSCVGEALASGAEVPISIRPHDIRLSARQPQEALNVVPGTVVRQVFLGSNRDYVVESRDGTQLRVLTAAAENIPTGTGVWLHLPPERCRALRR